MPKFNVDLTFRVNYPTATWDTGDNVDQCTALLTLPHNVQLLNTDPENKFRVYKVLAEIESESSESAEQDLESVYSALGGYQMLTMAAAPIEPPESEPSVGPLPPVMDRAVVAPRWKVVESFEINHKVTDAANLWAKHYPGLDFIVTADRGGSVIARTSYLVSAKDEQEAAQLADSMVRDEWAQLQERTITKV
jgi:hypothetical protein